MGIAKEAGPGLPDSNAWALEQGGTGFAPPYAFPKSQIEPFQDNVQVFMSAGAKSYPAGQSLATSYVENLTSRYPRPATVFCSRELEHGLVGYVENYVASTGRFPSDSMLKEQGRQITRMNTSPAEDQVLLEKFKDMMKKKLPQAVPMEEAAEPVTALPSNMDLNISDEELNNILQDMNFEFDTQDFDGIEQMEDAGGVSLHF